ncbi:hypothetical protein ABVG11_03675 [Streptomyces sp. HD1123-B1]|uniref:Rv1733c family protein n=1 Tax=Streptomyces TaxID=1883 RepID=UPI003D7077E8
MNTHGPRRDVGTHRPRAVARGRNPLRRRSDRIQSWCTALFLLTLVCGVPFAALSVAGAAYDSQLRVVHAEEAARHRVTARLAEDPPDGPRGADGPSTRQARVRWTGPDGARHSGLATVTGGTRAGDAVLVWVDRAGALVRAPASPSTARTVGWFTGALSAAAGLALTCAARARVRRALDRGRYARWEAEWKEVEPAWSGRNRR